MVPLRSRFLRAASAFMVACLLAVAPARAAEPPPFTVAELDQMLASIALLPDPLLSQVLMASTYPPEVAAAAKWASDSGMSISSNVSLKWCRRYFSPGQS